MDSIFQLLSNLTGIHPDQVKVFTLLILNYPLANSYFRIPTTQPELRHLFSIIVSLTALIFVMKLYTGTLHFFLSITATWVLLRWNHKYMPWAVFFLTMGDLMFNHWYRVIFDLSRDNYDITYAQMILTQKLTTLAWNIHDGRLSEDRLDKQQLASRVTEFPTVLEYLGYCFYFPGLLVGPTFEYSAYSSLVSGTLLKSPDSSKEEAESGPPGRESAAYEHMAKSIVFMGLWVVGAGVFSYDRVLEDAWLDKGWLSRLIWVQLIGFFQRTKYYGVWYLSEGACIITGLGFNGYSPTTGLVKWDRAANVHFWQVETAPNFKLLLDNWNCNTNVWLRNCVYKRVTPRGKKPGFRSTMLTFLVSAVWHGSETGYYLTFIQAGFVQTVGRMMRSNVRPFLLPPAVASNVKTLSSSVGQAPAAGSTQTATGLSSRPPEPEPTLAKRAYDIVGVMCTLMQLNYAVCPFMLLTVGSSLKAWSRMYWYGTWMTFGPMIFFSLGGGTFLRKQIRGRGERERISLDDKKVPPVVVLPPSPIKATS